jgi:hypothetical protein
MIASSESAFATAAPPKKLAAIVAAPRRVLSRVIVMGFVFPHAKVFVVHEWADFRRYGNFPAADLFLANVDLPTRDQTLNHTLKQCNDWRTGNQLKKEKYWAY